MTPRRPRFGAWTFSPSGPPRPQRPIGCFPTCLGLAGHGVLSLPDCPPAGSAPFCLITSGFAQRQLPASFATATAPLPTLCSARSPDWRGERAFCLQLSAAMLYLQGLLLALAGRRRSLTRWANACLSGLLGTPKGTHAGAEGDFESQCPHSFPFGMLSSDGTAGPRATGPALLSDSTRLQQPGPIRHGRDTSTGEASGAPWLQAEGVHGASGLCSLVVSRRISCHVPPLPR